ncbi:MAG: DUF4214 domain-containing protein [Pedosphaera sp.]|nr:DUF4214 domain-containing protein [Pedosphaera sp.]
MKHRIKLLFSLPIFLVSVHQSHAGNNSSVILNEISITKALKEGDLAILKGNVGDLASAPNDRFLNQIFVDLLGRTIEPGELDTYGALIAKGSRAQLAAALLASIEYREHLVQLYYQTYLRRTADAATLGAGAKSLASGTTGDQFAASVLGSDEYFTTRGKNNNSDFAKALYADLIGRDIDLSNLAQLIASLSGGATRIQLATQILASVDHRTTHVNGTYQHLLHRAPDPASLNTWVTALGNGTTPEAFLAALVGSDEYYTAAPKPRYSITVNWGDGTTETLALVPPARQDIFFPFEITHRYLDNKPKAGAPEPINVFLTLHANAGEATAVTQTTVSNIGPTLRNLAISNPNGVGLTTTLTGDILDTGILDKFTLLVDWGDGKGAQTIEYPGGTTHFTITRIYTVGGNLKVNVTLRDDDGAIVNQTVETSVTPNLNADAIPSVPGLLAADDTGVAPNDAVTTKNSGLRFFGTGKAGYRIDLFGNGQLIGFNTVDNTGKWTITVSSTLTEGIYQMAARGTDLFTIPSVPTTPLILFIDNTPPLVPQPPDLTDVSDNGISNTDNVTTMPVRKFVGTSEPGGLIELYADGNYIGIANVDAGGKWAILESSVPGGIHSYTVRAKDRAGNVSTTFSSPLIVNLVGNVSVPSVPALASGSDTGRSNSDRITSSSHPSFTGSSDPKANIQLLATGSVIGSAVADAAGKWIVSASSQVADGTTSFAVRAYDDLGAESQPSQTLDVTIDSTAPQAPTPPDLDAASDDGAVPNDNATTIGQPSFSGQAEPDSFVEILIDGKVVGSTTAKANGQWNFTVPNALFPAKYLISATATDVAGNNHNLHPHWQSPSSLCPHRRLDSPARRTPCSSPGLPR